MTKTFRATCQKRLEMRRYGIAPPIKLGEVITVLSEDKWSRFEHRYAVVVQDFFSSWVQSCPTRNDIAGDTRKILQQFLPPSKRPGKLDTDHSLHFHRACEDSSWGRDKSNPHRSDTNGIAERSVRRVKEGLATGLVQGGIADDLVERSNRRSIATKEKFQIHWQTDEHRMRSDLTHHSTVRAVRSRHSSRTHL